MLTIQIASFGDPLEVAEVTQVPDLERPQPGQVLVAVEYAPINPADLLVVRGVYGTLPALPARPGAEGVGRIIALGEGEDVAEGLETAPEAFMGLLQGRNFGKQLVRIADRR